MSDYLATPARIAHSLVGSPAITGASETPESRCYVCGEPAPRSLAVAKWMGSNFTDQMRCRAPWSDRVCEACAWSCSWVTPPGYVITGEMAAKKAAKRAAQQAERAAAGKGPAGKEKGESLRLFTHLYSGGKYRYAKKDAKADILAFLRAPKVAPWFAAVTDTGQKHVLPFAELNYGEHGGTILFEDRELALPPSLDGWRIVDDLVALLTAGATKDEVTRGEYRAETWIRCSEKVRAFDGAHSRLRGSAWFALVIWLSQRNEEAVKARHEAEKTAKEKKNGKRKGPVEPRTKRVAASGNGGRRARASSDVPRRGGEPIEALGADREPHPSVDADVGERGGVDHRDEAGPAPLHYEQVPLFGFDPPGR